MHEIEIYFKFILSFALILIAARIGGELAQRYLKQPPVVGELFAGILISPFALGSFLFKGDPIILNFATIKEVIFEPTKFSIFGNLTAKPIHIKEFHCMEIIAQIAVIVLLFVAGLETNTQAFLRRGLIGACVALGGVILPFLSGFFITKLVYPQIGLSGWLFMGAVLTATSIGLTVKILMDMKGLETKEGIVILVAAVIDDIIGVLVLSVVLMFTASSKMEVDLMKIVILFITGFGVWFALLLLGYFFHHYITKIFLKPFKQSGTMAIFALLLAFLISYLVTIVKLHPVVGAYVAGLMFSSSSEKEKLVEQTKPIMLFLAPFFFAYLGMQVDLSKIATISIGIFTIMLIVLATISKIIGCGIPAYLVGRLKFNEAMIVGIGMVPRGEVGLIIAGVGFLGGAISRELFGAAVIVSVATSLITPLLLTPFFRKKKKNNGSCNIRHSARLD